MDFQEFVDYYDTIEWAAVQPWSDGNVGLFGISYYAMSQYLAAALKLPHLKAIVRWEGVADPYRDIAYRGGIPCLFGYSFGTMMQFLANNPFTTVNYIELVFKHNLFEKLWEYGVGVIMRPKSKTPSILDAAVDIKVPMLSVWQSE